MIHDLCTSRFNSPPMFSNAIRPTTFRQFNETVGTVTTNHSSAGLKIYCRTIFDNRRCQVIVCFFFSNSNTSHLNEVIDNPPPFSLVISTAGPRPNRRPKPSPHVNHSERANSIELHRNLRNTRTNCQPD